MDINNQSQKAGDNSTQITAHTINITAGVSEERVRAIYKEECREMLNSLICEARSVAEQRVSKFEDFVISKFKQIDDSFDAVADPSFMILLRKAQLSAAMTDKDEDYETLSQLLATRVSDKEMDRSHKLSIAKATEIVSEVPEQALTGLVAVYTLTFVYPIAEDFEKRLETYEKTFADLLGDAEMPGNDRWIEDLDLLRLIRLNPQNYASFKKMKDYLPTLFTRVMVEGKEDSDPVLKQICENLEKNGLPSDIFIDHPLREGYKMIKYTLSDVDNLALIHKEKDREWEEKMTEIQKSILTNAINQINRPTEEDPALKDRLLAKWKSFKTLSMLTDWWDTLPRNFQITSVGKTLANAFVRLKFPEIPIYL